MIEIGSIKQSSGKMIYAWAVEQGLGASKIVSNSFILEWLMHSGYLQKFQEIDRGQWLNIKKPHKQKAYRVFILLPLCACKHKFNMVIKIDLTYCRL